MSKLSQYQQFKPFFKELAEISGQVVEKYFWGDDLGLELKSDDTPVTRADREAESVLRERIGSRYPDHGIIGEEFGEENTGAEFVWVLDPIDGTKSYAAGIPLYGTLLCLMHENRPVLGAIHQPGQRLFLIGDGQVTELNGKPVRVRDCSDLSQATLLTTDPLSPLRGGYGEVWQELALQVRLYRSWGDCWGYYMVASGRAHIMADLGLADWDKLSLIPIIRGAGGVITTWEGKDPQQGSSILATVPGLHRPVLELLNQ